MRKNRKSTAEDVRSMYMLSSRLNNLLEHDFKNATPDTLERIDDIHFILRNDKVFRRRFGKFLSRYRIYLDNKIDKLVLKDGDKD